MLDRLRSFSSGLDSLYLVFVRAVTEGILTLYLADRILSWKAANLKALWISLSGEETCDRFLRLQKFMAKKVCPEAGYYGSQRVVTGWLSGPKGSKRPTAEITENLIENSSKRTEWRAHGCLEIWRTSYRGSCQSFLEEKTAYKTSPEISRSLTMNEIA